MNALFNRYLLATMVNILVTLPLAAEANVVFRKVALSHTLAPGGARFNSFDAPVLNNSGRTAFSATLQTADGFPLQQEGIWSEGHGPLALIARSTKPAPGTPPGTNFGHFYGLVFNSSGHTAFVATLHASSGAPAYPYSSVWSEGSGTLTLLAATGLQAFAAPGGGNFENFEYLVLNNSGHVAFRAVLLYVEGQTAIVDMGIWSEGSGTLSLVAHTGVPAPGTPADTKFGYVFGDPVLNVSGHTAFYSTMVLNGTSVTYGNDEAIWSEASGTLLLAAREGSPAPGTGTLFGSRPAFTSHFGAPALNASGQTAFRASLLPNINVTQNNDEGIWSEGSGTLTIVAREGSQAPGATAGAYFGSFGDPVLNASGRTAFRAMLRTNEDNVMLSNDEGIWSEGSGTLALVAREGSHPPGTPANTKFGSLSAPALNASGRVAFYADLLTTQGVHIGQGIWAEDRIGTLTLVVREGGFFEVAPGDFRTIETLLFSSTGRESDKPSGGEDGRPMAFNDDFTLAFQATFTDGTSGIFTATLTAVPEPTTVALLCIAAMFAPRRRSR